MIKIDSEKAIMTFGTGDIGINTYVRTDIDENGIIFYNQEARKIGDIADIKANSLVEDINDFPIKMIFPKIESIDVVIGMLMELKKIIIEKENNEEMDCLVCNLSEENRCCDCCAYWDEEIKN